jgi:uncharacterized protein (TIGR00725 family)
MNTERTRKPGRLPIVGVMGSSEARHPRRAWSLGSWLAAEGVHLLTGGGSGVMAATSEAFASVAGRRGLVIGILPLVPAGSPASRGPYPNPWVEISIATHLPLLGDQGSEPLSRNHINVLTSDVIVALPGGPGTLSEVQLARHYGRPVVAWLFRRDEIPGLPEDVLVEADFERIKDFVRARIGEIAASADLKGCRRT